MSFNKNARLRHRYQHFHNKEYGPDKRFQDLHNILSPNGFGPIMKERVKTTADGSLRSLSSITSPLFTKLHSCLRLV